MIKIAGYNGMSTVDFPGKISCVIYTLGCMMRCPYCFNSVLIYDTNMDEDSLLDEQYIFDQIDERKDFIDAIVVSGGEPTIHHGLIDFIKKLQDTFDLPIKVDTCGANPEKVYDLTQVADYIAMDLKTSFYRYGLFSSNPNIWRNVIHSMSILDKTSDCTHEYRTTLWKKAVGREDIDLLTNFMSKGDAYYLQQLTTDLGSVFRPDEIAPDFYTKEEAQELAEIGIKKGIDVRLRGFE